MGGVAVVALLVGATAGWFAAQYYQGSNTGMSKTELPDSLPVVVFQQAGLLSARDKTLLEERVIQPMIDYHNENEVKIVTISVKTPAHSGEEYDIETFFVGGVYEGMIWGKKDGDIPYWVPGCLGPCALSDTFRAKHPEIVAQMKKYGTLAED